MSLGLKKVTTDNEVVLSSEHFDKLVHKLSSQKKKIAELQAALDFMNSQIRKYNKEFGNVLEINEG